MGVRDLALMIIFLGLFRKKFTKNTLDWKMYLTDRGLKGPAKQKVA